MFECTSCGTDLGFNPTSLPVGARRTCPRCGTRFAIIPDGDYTLIVSEHDAGWPGE
jgi:DNA-directed RNA polymerase subunit RPC12/RpoP